MYRLGKGSLRPMRPLAVLVHRWVGLALAAFLLIAGVTGALLAWYHELDRAISPELLQVHPPAPQAQPLDPLVLRERLQARYTPALVHYVPLKVEQGRALRFHLDGPRDARTGKEAELPFDEVFVNPYTGAVLGERKWGAIEHGLVNLMPFIYRLHFQLALGTAGAYVMGLAALLWTLDCFVGIYLTLPARRTQRGGNRGWWARWASAWRVRWSGGAYKLNLDLHRAGGLWPWIMLFVLAWSSVSFNLGEVYQPVMRSIFATQRAEQVRAQHQPAHAQPAMEWTQALQTGRQHMAALARSERFSVHFERSLGYDAQRGVFRYRVGSSLDIASEAVQTSVSFDATDGRLLGSHLPTGKAAGDTITSWLHVLHMAGLGGVPMKVFISLLGLGVGLLSVTGVYVWWKKRRARLWVAPIRRQGMGAKQKSGLWTPSPD
ncbi:PepSY-associated TM helix domain-containing protein [Azohydromonas aeria]|uniref:PepSY-associated TM helix domain-containing protein n=1 Tax=Azohydromonas aeria TaxID=2590212 RepID=UPI0018DFA33B|nr:PepSY-associated TM helix domain-containing protein [Azohydromonas aeria]